MVILLKALALQTADVMYQLYFLDICKLDSKTLPLF